MPVPRHAAHRPSHHALARKSFQLEPSWEKERPNERGARAGGRARMRGEWGWGIGDTPRFIGAVHCTVGGIG